MNEKEIVELFKQRGFRATPQRIAVYRYLCENQTHPDVAEIYANVVEANPSFSKTTVYNSLSALEECGLIGRIDVDGDSVRYDGFVALHGHFMCNKCAKIYDFDLNDIDYRLPNGFEVDQKYVYFRGICPECKAN